MALVRTNYGLIYNTDGSLCATLLPEGGVAVTEETTNLCDPAYMYTNTWTTIDYGWNRRTTINCTAGDVLTISADIRNLSQGSNQRWGYVSFYDSGGTALVTHYARDHGMSEQRLSFTTPPAPVGTVEARVYWVSSGDGVTYQGKNFQIEKKPYDTPFVDGTRPAGSLSYNLPISINGDWTIAKWLELEPYFMDKSRSGDNPIGKYRLPLLDLGEKYYTEGYGAIGIYGAWADSQPGKTIRIMANKDQVATFSSSPDTITLTEAEYNNKILAVLTKSGSMLTAYIYTVENKYVLTCNIASLGDISQIAPQLNYHTVTASNRMYCKRHLNTLVCPYVVSPETVATWHSLDAPFFDPREQIDAAARPIYAPGVIIDSTGAWGISNGVKQAGFGTDGKWMAGGGNIIADHDGMRFIGELGPDKPMIEFERETGKGKFRGEVAGTIVAWDDQMPLVTTEAFRQVNVSENSRANGPVIEDEGLVFRGYSQVNACNRGYASGAFSQANASYNSSAQGTRSQVNASRFSTTFSPHSQINASSNSGTHGDKSQVNASTYSYARGEESQVNASNDSDASGKRSQVNASYGSAASAEGSQVNASQYVKNNEYYSMAGGFGYSGIPVTANRKWHIFSNPGSGPTIQIATTLQSNYSFGDYGEYFESLDGQEIPVGHIVTLVGDKIRKANSLDPKYLGVISKTAGVILGGAGFCWQGRYLRDEFGGIVTQEIPDPTWEPKEGQTEEERPLITVEVENPEYDPEKEYLERAKRPEWHVVGMLGQVHVRIDSSVKAGGYIKSNNEGIGTADESAQGWYVMKVTTPYNEAKGYGVALCLVK